MSGAFTVSCIQFTSARDYEPNIRVVSDLVRRARDGGADFVMTPENTGLTEPVGKLRREKARDEANHPVLAALREVAQETGVWLLIGSLAVDLSREPGTTEGERRLANRSYLIDPGGAVTGRLLPTGQAREILEVPDLGPVTVSLVDATNPVVFVRAKDLGLEGTERPETLDARLHLARRLEAIRGVAAERMGLVADPAQATTLSPAVPKIAMVAPPAPFQTLDGTPVPAAAVDLVARVVSMGRIHRAFALTAAMCLAVAARIDGTVVHEVSADARPGEPEGDVRLGHPSGVLAVAARVAQDPGMPPVARTVTVYRTARRLMDGFVLVPV